MFRNLFFAAVLAALCAGLITSAVQYLRVTPLIVAAESFEGADHHEQVIEDHDHGDHDHGAEAMADNAAPPAHDDHAAGGHEHDTSQWAPEDGVERTAYTVLANLLMAAGFALIIGAVSLVFSLPITWATGLLWGLGGFAAFSLAPAFGLPPGLPGMPVADTFARQLWWALAALCTGGAFVLAAKVRAPWALAIAIALVALPHVVGAPQPPEATTAVPAGLAASFVSASLFNAAVFWVVLGLVFGRLHNHFTRQSAGAHS